MNYPITVLILTYNSAKTIRACLDSLCAQTYKEFSVHIIDDDSTDETVALVKTYNKKLRMQILKNGSHNIPRGRNIALQSVPKGIAAFMDSDDMADSKWLEIIHKTFKNEPSLAMISGKQVTAYRTTFARAIAANDDTMRQLFGGGILLFCTCNSAINRDVIGESYFNEDFINAEDIEFAERVGTTYEWRYIDEMKIHHTTRDTPRQYAKQMYLYGKWKLFYSYYTRTFRLVDFVPLVTGMFFLMLSLVRPVFGLGILLLPLAQTFVTAFTVSLKPTLFLASLMAWCIKNVMWSIGIVVGLYELATSAKMRSILTKQGDIS